MKVIKFLQNKKIRKFKLFSFDFDGFNANFECLLMTTSAYLPYIFCLASIYLNLEWIR